MTSLRTLQAWGARLVALIRSGSARGVLVGKRDDGLRVLQVQVGPDEIRDAEHLEPYGFTSEATVGAELLAQFVAHNRDHPLVLSVGDRRYRLKGLADGEVALYDDLGQVVHLKRDGIRVASSALVTIEAPTVAVVGDLEVDGNVTATGDVADAVGTLDELRQAYNAHTHPETGGTTGPPTPTVP